MKLATPTRILLTSGILIALRGPTMGREWKSADGRTMEADYVAREGDSIILLRAGKKLSVQLAKLSAEDQAWVQQQQPANPGPKSTPTSPPKAATGEYASLLTGDWALSKHKALPFALFGAKDLDATKQYPLILALHGKSSNDENGKQIGGWMNTFTKKEAYEKNPCFVVAPLCYQPYGGTGGGWSDKPGTEALDLVENLLKKLPLIDKNRVYVIGYSMGGFGAFHLVNQEPKLFAAAVPVAGYGQPGMANNLRRVPIWLFHAKDDTVVKVEGSRSLAKAMERSKGFKYTELESGGHGIIGQVFDDQAVHDWLFQQSRK